MKQIKYSDEMIINLYKNGKAPKEIAEFLEISKSAVIKRLGKEYIKQKNRLSEEDRKKAIFEAYKIEKEESKECAIKYLINDWGYDRTTAINILTAIHPTYKKYKEEFESTLKNEQIELNLQNEEKPNDEIADIKIALHTLNNLVYELMDRLSVLERGKNA